MAVQRRRRRNRGDGGTMDSGSAEARGGRRVRGWLQRRWLTGPGWTGATVAVAVTALALWGWRAAEQILPGAAAASWRILVNDPLLACGVTVVVALLLTGVVAALRRHWPVPFLAVLVGALLLLVTMGAGASRTAWLLLCVVAVTTAALIGGAVGGLLAGGSARPGRGRVVAAAVSAATVAVVAAGLAWPGPGADAPDLLAVRGGEAPADPSARGPHEVTSTSYASAVPGPTDHYASADVTTSPVDASGLISGWRSGDTRSQVWGFDASALPVNGAVWAPAEGGPFPLVLIAHGNSPHADSDLGFAYLADVLASRGYVVASLDMGFLNTSVLDRAGGIVGADRTRAWLVLQHLRQWAAWQEGGGPVAAQVDLGRVALVGHSRGGEAVAAATALDALGSDPELPGHDLTTGVTISSVVALAPSDGLVPVGGEPVVLQDVNYLTLAGSHDADVGAFAGSNQYARTATSDDTVKAAVLIHRANHSQFNARWGRYDVGLGLSKHVLDTAALLAPEQQRQVATVLVSAFLDHTLRDDRAAGTLFDGTLPEAGWLPDTGYRVAAASGERGGVIGFDDAVVGAAGLDTSLGTVPVEGASATVAPLPLRVGTSDNPALHLSLDGGPARVGIPVEGLGADARVVVDLAQLSAGGAPVTVHLEVTDAGGAVATCPVTGPDGIPDQLSGQTVKLAVLQPTATSEPALQSYAVSPACASGPGGDLGPPASVAIVLEAEASASVLVDNLGVVP
ncbi:hypothetical protein MWU75_00275 [Ornithinimicrobium sp. F0845]|uniref:poly(ethylene terephthalate) hydrolase family protein n=1 Tax=Ornithinimicrobium sp. F0845 TaxID=2926412 RepID=UPI001FF628E0|nr:hypothetical protein [Ornithinimicrobium sp. F0845]MCK0110582.1 hypothetical protein [Ornithinimicrobium sp. F0845]